ncbi:Hypothetical protein R9X50_00698600 [Acrodontium crateriforme]|uniref:Uncharacterized protein n=1 Tax=Acrodontium crateriforme TaxID=150365 RepID=A0AAQ3R776_9PEZI|nr:Hypothetical protein R9X50_00698600 [Acrodontium crateriforme]
MATSIFASLFRRAPQISSNIVKFPYTLEANPYKCKRTWPPDFSKLSQKHQFRLERRYRRRTKLKWARPTWTKAVKIAQWSSIIFVLVYGVLYLEIEDGMTPFEGIRRWYQDQLHEFEGARDVKKEDRRGVAPKG